MRKIIPQIHWRSFAFSTLALLGALSCACVVSLIILAIQHQSDQRRQEQIVLMRLDKKIYQLHDLEVEMSSNPWVVHEDMQQLEVLNQELERCMDPLPPEARRTHNWVMVQEKIALYQQTIRKEMLLYLINQAKEARAVHDDSVNHAADVLSEEIYTADRTNNDRAVLANRIADFGTGGVLIATALLVFILVRRFEGARRRSAQLSTEQEMLSRSEQRFRALIRNASDVIAIVTLEGSFRYLSSAVKNVWGYEVGSLEETSIYSLLHSDEIVLLQTMIVQSQVIPAETFTVEIRLRTADEEWRLFEIILTNQLEEAGIEGIVLTCRDISERKAFEKHLAHQAFHDVLTRLPNRALFMERLSHALSRSRRQETMVAVVFLDLDNFKVINDSLGHEAGDRLLVAVAERLSAVVRAGDTVARLGGDEFTILLEDLIGEEQIEDLVERITKTLQTPITLAGREIVISGSLGIAKEYAGGRSPDQLLRDADTAMYQAKGGGKARSVVFDNEMSMQAMDRLELEIALRNALENGKELQVYYQPIISLDTEQIREVEALVRWEHPERGLLLPGVFIPMAEETGLIHSLGLWVLGQACGQLREWQLDYPSQMPLSVSVNISSSQLQHPDLVAQVTAALNGANLSPEFLTLEITESVMMHDPDSIIPRLQQLRDLGVRLVVDDFGTGYSSMSYLSCLPIDTLKIDRSFIMKMNESEDDSAIVHAIVSLAKSMKLRIISEGIETALQCSQLTALGCDLGQGYLFARPISAEGLECILSKHSLENAITLKAA